MRINELRHNEGRPVIVHSGKSEAEVTIIKDYSQGIVLLKLTTDRHEASCGLSATAELLVSTYDRAMYSLSVLFSEILLFILENIY